MFIVLKILDVKATTKKNLFQVQQKPSCPKVFLTHIRILLHPCKDQPTDLHCNSMDWFLYEYDINLESKKSLKNYEGLQNIVKSFWIKSFCNNGLKIKKVTTSFYNPPLISLTVPFRLILYWVNFVFIPALVFCG